jgi:hypothetical protein
MASILFPSSAFPERYIDWGMVSPKIKCTRRRLSNDCGLCCVSLVAQTSHAAHSATNIFPFPVLALSSAAHTGHAALSDRLFPFSALALFSTAEIGHAVHSETLFNSRVSSPAPFTVTIPHRLGSA